MCLRGDIRSACLRKMTLSMENTSSKAVYKHVIIQIYLLVKQHENLANLCFVTSKLTPKRWSTQWLPCSPRRQPKKSPKTDPVCAEWRGVKCSKAWRTGTGCHHLQEGPGAPTQAGVLQVSGGPSWERPPQTVTVHDKGSRNRLAMGRGAMHGYLGFLTLRRRGNKWLQSRRNHGKKFRTQRHTIAFPTLWLR